MNCRWCVLTGTPHFKISFSNPKGYKIWKPFISLVDDLNLALTLLDKLLASTADGGLKMSFENTASLALSKSLKKKSQTC